MTMNPANSAHCVSFARPTIRLIMYMSMVFQPFGSVPLGHSY